MLVRTSLFLGALAMLAAPIAAQQNVPSGRQELAEQQQSRDAAQGQGQQAQPEGQIRQAQPQRQPQQLERTGQAQGQTVKGSGEIDVAQVAQMFILGNKAEVELGNLALEKSQNENVREFAQMMVKDHTAFIAKLNKFAGNQAVRNTDARPSTTGAQPQTQQSGGDDAMANLHRKSAELELAMTKQMLSQYEGQDFDMGYLGQQMVAHTKMLACLTAAKDVGPQEFQTTIEEGIKTTREHMQHGKQLAATIKNKEYGEGQRREAARPDLRDDRQPRDGVIREGQPQPKRDGGARPSVRPQDSDVPREGAPQQGTPRVKPSDKTDGAPESARDREGVTP